jgi:phage terminase small subunit
MSRTGKHSSLVRKNETKHERTARASRESMVKPLTELTITPPAELKGKRFACVEWVRVLTLQAETQAAKDGAPIITAFDERTLVTFCKMVEEERTLESKLDKLDRAQDELYKKVSKMKPTKDTLKDYVSLWTQYNGVTSNFKGMSARLDAHRNSIHELAKSMYLTPSSRSGVAPTQAEPEEPKSEMEKLLDGDL